MRFKSAVDWWYYLVIAAAAIVVIIAVIPLVRSGQISVLPATGIVILSAGLPFWLLLSTAYRVNDGILRVRSGPFSWTIPLDEIHATRPSRSLVSSPALSLDRIEIQYGSGRSILVSPKDRKGFLDAIGQSMMST